MTPSTTVRSHESLTSDEARALCRDAMAIWKNTTGRGATYSAAHGNPGSTTLIFREVLTQVEQSLVEHGDAESVREGRRALFNGVRDEMIEAVERSAATPVESVLYDIDPDQDTCAFTFVFARPLSRSEQETR